MEATNHQADDSEYNLYSDARRLARAVDGIGEKTARGILKQTGGIVGMYQHSRSEMEALDGVGPATVDTIGLWLENGERVGKIPEDPCPECGGEFDQTTSKTLTPEKLEGAVRICSTSHYSRTTVTHYIHREEGE